MAGQSRPFFITALLIPIAAAGAAIISYVGSTSYIVTIAIVMVIFILFRGQFLGAPNNNQQETIHNSSKDIGRPDPPTISASDSTATPARKSIIQAKFAAIPEGNIPDGFRAPRWRPTCLFLYGTLKDPEVLQSILGLGETPVLQKAKLNGWLIKRSGNSPTLVRGNGCAIGMVYEVQTKEHFKLLEIHKGKSYDWALCDIQIEGDEKVRFGRTFRWKGSADSKELGNQ